MATGGQQAGASWSFLALRGQKKPSIPIFTTRNKQVGLTGETLKGLLDIHLEPHSSDPLRAIRWHSTLGKCFSFMLVNKTREGRQMKEKNNCLLSPIQPPTEPIWKKRIQCHFPVGCWHDEWHHIARLWATNETLWKRSNGSWGHWGATLTATSC
jgi:hypothetical protein